MLLGAPVVDVPPEVREHVTALAGHIQIGDEGFSVVRPMVSTPTAKVDVAGNREALRLPALRGDASSPTTYGRWMLATLGLPVIDVPSAPTRPFESSTSPLSINDYMLYCHLTQEEIDSSVFGSRDHFKDIKRRYVFEVLYGLYDAELAGLQESIRRAQQELRGLEVGVASFDRFLVDTPWENRATLAERIDETRAALARLGTEEQGLAARVGQSPVAQNLRDRLQGLDSETSDLRASLQQEMRSKSELEQLSRQLETQSMRLTRSIVTNDLLLDFDFLVCPRCGSDVVREPTREDTCYLCHQAPAGRLSREDLIREQDRIEIQVRETAELIDVRRAREAETAARLRELEAERRRTSSQLDASLGSFVSDQAEEIAERARRREELEGRIEQLTDYLRLYSRLDATNVRIAELSELIERLDAELETRTARRETSVQQIAALEATFGALVDAVQIPRFPGNPRAGIDGANYMPIVNGRSFSQLSSGGLKLLTNVAHAVAHHQTALNLDLRLPGLLMLDGIGKNVGHDEYDASRVEAVFRTLIELSEAHGDELQIIVSANDVPDFAEQYVAVSLSEEDRLIPLPSPR